MSDERDLMEISDSPPPIPLIPSLQTAQAQPTMQAIPEMQQQPLPPPTPMIKENQTINKDGTQTVKREVIYPRGMQSPLAPSVNHHTDLGARYGVQKSFIDPVEQLNEIANDDNKRMSYSMTISRKKPLFHNGKRLLCSTLEDTTPIPFADLEIYLEQTYGGGSYGIDIHNVSGQKMFTIVKNIPLMIEPRDPVRGGGLGPPTSSLYGREQAVEMDEASKMRIAENVARAETSAAKAKRERDRELKRIKQEEREEQEAEEEERERKEMRPEIARIESQMAQMQNNFQNTIKDALHGIKDVVTARAAPQDDSKLTILMESIKAQAAAQAESQRQMIQMIVENGKQTTAMITEMIKSNAEAAKKPAGPDPAIEAMKMIAEAQAKSSAAQAEASRAAVSESKALVTQLITATLTKPADQNEMFIQGMKMQQTQLQNAIQLVEAKRDDERPLVDPDGSPWAPLINTVVSIGKEIVTARMSAPPPQPPAMRPQIVARVQPSPQMRVAQNPPPQQRPAQAPSAILPKSNLPGHIAAGHGGTPQSANTIPPIEATATGNGNGTTTATVNQNPFIHEHVDASNVHKLYQVEPEAAAQPTEPPAAEVIAPEATPVESAPVAAPAPLPPDADTEAYLQEWVTAAVNEAIKDIKINPAEYEWVDTALAKWPAAFLDQLAAVPEDSNADQNRIALISQHCDPAVWGNIAALFYENDGYAKYIKSVHELIAERKGVAA